MMPFAGDKERVNEDTFYLEDILFSCVTCIEIIFTDDRNYFLSKFVNKTVSSSQDIIGFDESTGTEIVSSVIDETSDPRE